MSDEQKFTTKQVGLIVFAAVCCCVIVFVAITWKSEPQIPYGTRLLQQIHEAQQQTTRPQNDFSGAYDRAYTKIQLERTRRAAEEAEDAARKARQELHNR